MTKRTEPMKWWEAILVDICGSITLFMKAVIVGAGLTLGILGMIGWLA